MTTRQTIPDYADKAYDLCDILDRLAERPAGELLASGHIQKLLGLTVKAYPKVAEDVLGSGAAQRALIAYKATDDTDLIDQARAALGPAAFRAALEQLIAAAQRPPVKPPATVTEKDAPPWSLEAACNGPLMPDDWRLSR